MIQHQKNVWLLIVLFSSASFAEVSDKSIDKILDLSGLTVQVAQFPGLIKTGMSLAMQQGEPLPEINTMLKMVDETVLVSEILQGIRASLKSSLNENEAQQLLVWYESDIGKEITAAEEKASTPDAVKQIMQEAQ